MKPKVNRTGGYEWLLEHETVALLNVLRNGKIEDVRIKGRWRTVDFPPQPDTWALVMFLLHTGARLTEAYALKWADVDLTARTIKLSGGKVGRQVKPVQPRINPMNDSLIYLFDFLAPGDRDQPVFKCDDNLHRTMDRAFQCAGMPRYKLTALRDTYASHLAMRGVPLEQIVRLLGVSLRQVHRYAFLCPVDIYAAAKSLDYGELSKGRQSDHDR